ncbi:hypothetical protein RIF23_13795 [Lipingzhangella sp. LS1_29]|uniref:Secreted protein n=1 Tax=Lipingzhangella rawalii TaxID=2055835 RepID=A0ABU2H7U4_9ACTN|nr:hypothetical protein [Lipingzhangella rawalii]MDS1271371.1 hypothetical protein [Lipingzhangella rawalii]
MIRRLFYFLTGLAVGAYAVHRLNRTARAWSPEQIAGRIERRMAGYRSAVRELGADVHSAMEHREAELQEQHGLAPTSTPGDVPRRGWADGREGGAPGTPEGTQRRRRHITAG